MKKYLIMLFAFSEALTGIALFIAPSFICGLIFGEEVLGVGVLIARIAGIALIALGMACWSSRSVIIAMLFYSTSAMLYLAYVGVMGDFTGLLLWPAVIFHGLMSVLLLKQ